MALGGVILKLDLINPFKPNIYQYVSEDINCSKERPGVPFNRHLTQKSNKKWGTPRAVSTGTRGLCYPAGVWEAAQQARASYRAGFWATHPVSSPLVQRPRAAEGGHCVLTQEALILLEEVVAGL